MPDFIKDKLGRIAGSVAVIAVGGLAAIGIDLSAQGIEALEVFLLALIIGIGTALYGVVHTIWDKKFGGDQ